MKNTPLPRLDESCEIRKALLPYCRLKAGEIWEDPLAGHRVGCLDASSLEQVLYLTGDHKTTLAIHDPPYNLVAFDERPLHQYVEWCARWIENTDRILSSDSSLYVWLGADQNDGFQPLPDFMVMMRGQPFRARSFITVRNQRGYGTQKNWMAVRQELLYYVKGRPTFNVDAEYTDIPKILRGYYKEVNGQITENLQRSRSENIRAGNVWVDVQQVFYRMEENVSGCYAQKPLKSIDRIIRASSAPADVVVDFFSHSGTTLLGAEINNRRCFTMDIDPLFCEITIRRLEHYRRTGRVGWQNGHPFEDQYDCPRQDEAEHSKGTRSQSKVAQPSLF
ncbi:MAG: site-specific DNA-methyltransferase [Planctomycetales bacterium]|nr:site-specific DNA-methyltransferase [Planctomycetales bacterium]